MVMNVTEAVIGDLLNEKYQNAANGYALLEDLRNRSRHNGSGQLVGEMDFDVSWVQLYMVWNMSFCVDRGVPEILCKLFIPSVVDATHPRWLERRIAARRMTIVSSSLAECKPNWDLLPLQKHFSMQASVLKKAHHHITRGTFQRQRESCTYRALSKVMRSVMTFVQWVEYLV